MDPLLQENVSNTQIVKFSVSKTVFGQEGHPEGQPEALPPRFYWSDLQSF